MGSYTLDSHNVRRYVTPDSHVQNEGDIGISAPRPYEIACGSIVPKKAQCPNLLVPVCVSSSQIAFGSIRMEPVFMVLGQSAAKAACLSLDREMAVQDLPYDVLSTHLLTDGQVLKMDDPHMISSRKMRGEVVDDRQAKFIGGLAGVCCKQAIY
ncbi:MAG: FAD-dependent oxidoreductase [Fuerstiella sp.]|jgi:hypothetical protein|nr:FAD-dependent oxidoreductase [Fuerstiella sp.]